MKAGGTRPPGPPAPRRGRAWRLAALGVALLVLGVGLSEVARDGAPRIVEAAGPLGFGGAMALLALTLAVPFVPGAEIGLAILAMYGAAAAPAVWATTCAGLSIAYLAGRTIPERKVAAGLGRLGLARAQALVAGLAPLSRDERLAHLVSGAPARWVPLLLRHRYLALALAINLPGNSVVGGGGGLALAAGLSGLYAPAPFAATVALAVLPVPLAFLAFG